MTTETIGRHHEPTLYERLLHSVALRRADARRRAERRREIARVIRELESYRDEELIAFGFFPCDIPRIARETVDAKSTAH